MIALVPCACPSPPAMGRGIVTTVRAMTTMGARSEARSDEQVRRDDRAHVFHSWSAQGLIDPLPIAGAEGCWFWDYDGNRYLDFSSQLVNTNIGHQHPKVVAAIQEQAAAPVHRRARLRQRPAQRGGPAHRRGGAGRPRRRLLHQRRRRGHRERHPDGAPAHRPPQGPHHLPQLPRLDLRRDHDDRRPAPLAVRPAGAPRRRALLRAVPLPLVVRRHHRRRGGRRARCATSRRCSPSKAPAPSPPSCSRPSSARTASSSRPTATSPVSASCATPTAS